VPQTYVGLHVKYPIIRIIILIKFVFSWSISKNTDIPNFILKKAIQSEPSFPCGQTDEWTDITKSIVAFRNFANAPKTWKYFSIHCSLISKRAFQY